MISAKQITVETEKKKTIIENINIDISPAKITSVIGKNGAGKSTVLKAICGEVSYKKGSVFWDNTNINDLDIVELAKKRAVVSQKTSLNFSFKVSEVVQIGRTPYTGFFSTKKDEEIVARCIEKVGLSNLSDRSYTTLSGGEQQRVHLARALAQIWDSIEAEEESFLFLDEPLASLDIAHQHEIMHLLKQLTQKNVAVFIVIHDLNLAAQYSDNIVILKNGSKLIEGTPFEVLTKQVIFDAFDHPVNIIPHPKTECPLIISEQVFSN